MKLLHVADVHLGASCSAFGELARDRRREVLDTFGRLPDTALEQRADAILVAGDLFEGPHPDQETLAAVREMLRRLVDACIPTFLVPGNHDAVTLKLNPYRELARAGRVVVQGDDRERERWWPPDDAEGRRLARKHSIYVLSRPTFGEPVSVETENGTLHVYGIAYDAAECRDPLATFRRHDRPGVHVALLHAAVHDAPHWRTSGNVLALTTDALHLLQVDYIALGDCHRLRPPEEFGGIPACYPGSFAATDLTEQGPRGFVVAEVTPGEPATVEHFDSGVRPVLGLELDVSSYHEDVQVAEAAAHAFPRRSIPVLRLVGEPPYPLDADLIAAELRERHGHAEVIDETRYYASARLEELALHDTVAGHVVRLGRERIAAAATADEREVAQRSLRIALRALEVD